MYHIKAYSLALVREKSVPFETRPLGNSPGQIAELVRKFLGDTTRENMVIVLLDSKLKVIGLHTNSMGTINRAIVYPREVFQTALLANAAGIALVHNHPGGDPHPSMQDDQLTQVIKQGAALLDIRVVDHIIIADGTERFYSYKEAGRL